MKNLNHEILKEMENKTSVTVSLDDINGIFVKAEKDQEFNSFYFMYSIQNEFNVSIRKINKLFTHILIYKPYNIKV